jgi:hypothetical protein
MLATVWKRRVSCSPARSSTGARGSQHREVVGVNARSHGAAAVRPILEMGKMLQNGCMFLDWTNWTFWVTAIALVAFGFCLRDIYEQWRFLEVRKDVRDKFREVDNLTRRLQAATERLNKANAKAEAARLRSGPK